MPFTNETVCASEEYIAIRDWHMPVTNMEEMKLVPAGTCQSRISLKSGVGVSVK